MVDLVLYSAVPDGIPNSGLRKANCDSAPIEGSLSFCLPQPPNQNFGSSIAGYTSVQSEKVRCKCNLDLRTKCGTIK